jgi:hypothetical protein
MLIKLGTIRRQIFTILTPTPLKNADVLNGWSALVMLQSQIREQMSGPDLHVFRLKFLDLKKLFFPPIQDTF